MEQEHKRRPRYKGTHPRNYSEKYKELHPERYQLEVEKIIRSGHTPAGTHIPIMVDEILDFLQIRPGQTGLDATLGYGGHSRRMLEQLQGQGHLYALDVDPIEIEKTKARLAGLGYGPDILTVRRMNFADVDQAAPGEKFDFVLADLGVSSMQIDNPERGFTFKYDGPLDLRLDPTSGVPAAQRLRELDEEELTALFVENSDEPYAARIAKAVMTVYRKGGRIDTTKELAAVIESALSFLPAGERKEAVKKSCQRVFQALRIDVNSEFEVLYAFLDKLPDILKDGGRAAILKAYYLKNPHADCPEEVLTVGLNETSTNPAYTLGRLFAVYEAVQQAANPGINATIKDKYFNSAAAMPASIFPVLNNLYQKHLRKLNTGSRIVYDRQVSALKGILDDSYPARMTLAQQGSFDLGYYHQKQKRYTKKEENENV